LLRRCSPCLCFVKHCTMKISGVVERWLHAFSDLVFDVGVGRHHAPAGLSAGKFRMPVPYAAGWARKLV
jgi:hypothetical protein